MAFHEKRIRSPRYLWRMFVYGFNLWMIFCAVGVAGWCARLSDADKITELLRRVSETAQLVSYDATALSLLRICIFVCFALSAGILWSLMRFIGYDMEHRLTDEKALSAMGYRTGAIVRYESEYFLFDFFFAWVLAWASFALIWQIMKQKQVVQIFLDVMEVNYFVRIWDALLVLLTLALCVWMSVGRVVRRTKR